MDIPLRRAFIEIENPDKAGEFINFEGMDIKFKAKKVLSGECYEATVSICNLTKDRMAKLTAVRSFDNNIAVTPQVILRAGYNDDPKIIYTGRSKWAVSSPSVPDRWFDFKLLAGQRLAGKIYEFNIAKDQVFTVKEMYANIARQLAVELDYRSSNDGTYIKGAQFKGDFQRLLDYLQTLGKFIVNIDDTTMHVWDEKPKDEPEKDKVWRISPDTGMIGAPTLENLLITHVTILLNPNIEPDDYVHVESKIIPEATDLYRVMSVEHVGHLRGNDFYTILKLQRLS